MKKQLKFASLLILAAGVTGASVAFGATPPAPPAPPAIEGSWGTQQSEGGFQFDMTFTIQKDTITVTNLCTFQGKTLSAQVSAPAQYDDHSLTVLASADDQESKDGVNCNVSVKPDRMNYQVTGSTLVLSHEGASDQFALQRK